MTHYGHGGDLWIVVLVGVGWAGWLAYQRVEEWREPDEMEKLHQRYLSGEIDEQEMERRLDFLMDERNEEIRKHVERVNGVGPVVAREVALSFESVDDLRGAGRNELEDVPGVGPERADAILDRMQ